MVELQFNSCLVTGGAGFVGSHLCEESLKQGKKVVCLDNLAAGKIENIRDLLKDPNFIFVKADVTNCEEIEKHFKGVEVVFHNAASKCTVCRDNPLKDLLVNAYGSWSVFEAARLHGVKKIIHASTGSVYGEPRCCPLTEQHPFLPQSFYGVSKLAGESYLHAFKDYYPGLQFSIIRYFHVYGPRQESSEEGGVIPIFIRKALSGLPLTIFGDGSQIRSFTHVQDVVEANFLIANAPESCGQDYNAASGIKITILELAEMILSLLDRQGLKILFLPWRPGDIKYFHVENRKIKDLGLTFHKSFNQGLAETVQWYINKFQKQIDFKTANVWGSH